MTFVSTDSLKSALRTTFLLSTHSRAQSFEWLREMFMVRTNVVAFRTRVGFDLALGA